MSDPRMYTDPQSSINGFVNSLIDYIKEDAANQDLIGYRPVLETFGDEEARKEDINNKFNSSLTQLIDYFTKNVDPEEQTLLDRIYQYGEEQRIDLKDPKTLQTIIKLLKQHRA